jgi:hypothetical protein
MAVRKQSRLTDTVKVGRKDRAASSDPGRGRARTPQKIGRHLFTQHARVAEADFTVDLHHPRRDTEERRSDPRQSTGPVGTVAREQAHRIAILDDLKSVPIPLDFVCPAIARRGLASGGRRAGRNERGAWHSSNVWSVSAASMSVRRHQQEGPHLKDSKTAGLPAAQNQSVGAAP